MAKSFKVTLEDGTVVDALDAGEMLKSLSADVGTLKTLNTDFATRLEAAQGERDKALSVCEALVSVTKQQGDLLKALQADVKTLGSQGAWPQHRRGRAGRHCAEKGRGACVPTSS